MVSERWFCKSLVLLEAEDGGEGILVWHKEGSKRGEEEVERGGVEVCNQCQEEGRANKGSGWLATPTGCRLLAQVIFISTFSQNRNK